MKRMIAITFVILLLLTSCGEQVCGIPIADYETDDLADFLEHWMQTDNYQEQKVLYDTKAVEFPVPRLISKDYRLSHIEIYYLSEVSFRFEPCETPEESPEEPWRSLWVVVAVDGTTFDEVTKEHGLETGKTYAYRVNGNVYEWYFRGSDGRCITVTFPADRVVDTPEKARDYITFVGIEEFLGQ